MQERIRIEQEGKSETKTVRCRFEEEEGGVRKEGRGKEKIARRGRRRKERM